MRRLSPLDAAWLMIESRDTPMHVGGLFEFTLPDGAGPGFLGETLEEMRSQRNVVPPWNLRLVDGPVVGHRLPLMTEEHDVDLDYHVRRSALPHPGGQRELGILISRLHSIQLDLHRPLWEMHLIEGLERDRFAIYVKMHHSLIDGVSGIRMALRTFSADPEESGMKAFWTVGEGSKRRQGGGSARRSLLDKVAREVSSSAAAAIGLGRAGVELGIAALDDSSLSAPYTAPSSTLGGRLAGQRRFATQQYEMDQLKTLAKAAECTLNDIVLYLASSALRRYLGEHARIPMRSLTAGIPVNLREAEDESAGNAIGFIIAELGTNFADERERLEAIKASTQKAKNHLKELPHNARTPYTLLLNAPYIGGLMAGLGGAVPVPFNLAVSNVPGPREPLYFNGARLDALFPLSLITHGNALNITCISYAGTMNFGFTGARDTLPHLQSLALYMRDSLEEAERIFGTAKKQRRGGGRTTTAKSKSNGKAPSSGKRKSASSGKSPSSA